MNMSFTLGLIVGQLSVIALLMLIIKYFIFSDVDVAIEKRRRKKMKGELRAEGEEGEEDTKGSTEKEESVEWMNLLLKSLYAVYRQHFNKVGKEKIEEMLNRRRGGVMDRIIVNDVGIGDKYPNFSNARYTQGKCYLDFDYNDELELDVTTKLMINYPKPRFGSIPVDVVIRLIRFSGSVWVEVDGGEMTVGLSSNYNLNIKCQSYVGSRAKLKDVPKIEELIYNNLDNILTNKLSEYKFKIVDHPPSPAITECLMSQSQQLPTLEPKAYSSLAINQKNIVELSGDKDLYLFKLDNISHHQPSEQTQKKEPSKSEMVARRYMTDSTTPSSSRMSRMSSVPSVSSVSMSTLSTLSRDRDTRNHAHAHSPTNRQPLACIGCRKQKLKCLGGKPCQRCDKRGKDCVYDTQVRRRGPDRIAGGRLKPGS
ncbi:hypothetical protein E3P85_03274 [Wallemia ichthyophaga]|nr:hypothetical protein E3P85_03274 [Wallemia ichthyophaga]